MKTFNIYISIIALMLAGCVDKDWQSMVANDPNAPDQARETEMADQNHTKQDKISPQKAMFAAGCFWGIQSRFDKIEGIINTEVGYSGGNLDNPTYQQVCTGRTNHAEVVMIEFDPEMVKYEQLLHVFWRCHDPTQLNRQGPDFGTQYRSAIFYYNDLQKQSAIDSKAELERYPKFKGKIATLVEPVQEFWKAEEYHQKYNLKRGSNTCPVPRIWSK